MKAEGFWTPGVTAFFDVRVTNVNCRSNQGKHAATIFKEQENEKKRKYIQRVMDVEMGTFTPLVFGTNGGMGLDCQNFLTALANKLSTKNDEPYASVISWLRIQLSFAILRTVHRCVRGSRYPFKSREVRTPRVRRFGIFPSMQSTTKLEQIGSTRDLSATREERSLHN